MVAATAGSTNAVLHLLAIAREAGVPWTHGGLRTGLGADAGDRRPAARRPLHRGGAVRRRRQRARGAGADRRRHAGGRTHRHRPQPVRRSRRRAARRRAGRGASGRRAAEAARRLFDPVRQPRAGGLHPQAGRQERRQFDGRARVFESEEEAFAAVQGGRIASRRRHRDPQRRPGRRPRHARDARRHRGAGRPRPRQRRGADHRRPLLRRHPRLHGRPHRARSGARRPDRPAARRRPHRDRRPRAASCAPPPTWRHAAPSWQPRPPRVTHGALAKYAHLVGSASDGATTRADTTDLQPPDVQNHRQTKITQGVTA